MNPVVDRMDLNDTFSRFLGLFLGHLTGTERPVVAGLTGIHWDVEHIWRSIGHFVASCPKQYKTLHRAPLPLAAPMIDSSPQCSAGLPCRCFLSLTCHNLCTKASPLKGCLSSRTSGPERDCPFTRRSMDKATLWQRNVSAQGKGHPTLTTGRARAQLLPSCQQMLCMCRYVTR